MLIDWFTMLAQAINFLLLMYLLKRFLYGPIIRAMDDREEKIAMRLEEARQKKDEADREAEDYRRKAREIDKKRNELIDEARDEAETTRRDLAEKARMEIDELRNNWLSALEQSKKSFLEDLRKRTIEHVYKTVRHALSDLATAKLEEHIISVFIDRIENLDSNVQKEMQEALIKAGGRVAVASAFEIPEDNRNSITRAIHSTFENGITVEYETESGLISGIELKIPGRIIAWNLNEYLKSLEEELSETYFEQSERATT